MIVISPSRENAVAVIETYVKHDDERIWQRDSSRWTWYCLTGECGKVDEVTEATGSVDPLPDQHTALLALEAHQLLHHVCPDCGGSGYDVNMDGTDNGDCLRCEGHGVWLGASS